MTKLLINEMLEVLYDVKNEGDKEIAWRKHKLVTLRLAQAYKRISSHKYKRIVECAGYMEFRRYADNSLRLHTANFCQTRLCPTCNWRRARKMFAQISRIMGAIEKDYDFVFLTLTCKNIEGKDLKNQIEQLFSAFKALCLRKRFKSAVCGWVRCFEITFNWTERKFHPHFHIVLAVDKDYFSSDKYLTQNEFCEMWQSCLKVDYKPIVDVRVFKESEKGKGKEVAEVAKYTIKSSNIMADLRGIEPFTEEIQVEAKRLSEMITDEIVFTLDSVLARRRLIGYGGIFKEKHKALNLDTDIDSDLVHAGDYDTRNDLSYTIERYHWNVRFKSYIKFNE